MANGRRGPDQTDIQGWIKPGGPLRARPTSPIKMTSEQLRWYRYYRELAEPSGLSAKQDEPHFIELAILADEIQQIRARHKADDVVDTSGKPAGWVMVLEKKSTRRTHLIKAVMLPPNKRCNTRLAKADRATIAPQQYMPGEVLPEIFALMQSDEYNLRHQIEDGSVDDDAEDLP